MLLSVTCVAENNHLDPNASYHIYFYNPETNVNRSSVLKQQLDAYLSQHGNYRFQPVKKQKTFIQLLEQDKHAAFMMPSWLYHETNHASLSPKLVGVKNHSPYFKKLLVLHNNFKLNSTDKLIIASTGTLSYNQDVFAAIQNRLETPLVPPKMLPVPKDLDALLSVGFGMAQGALSTEDSLSELKRLYSNQHEQLSIIGESPPKLRLMVLTHTEHSHVTTQLITTLNAMHDSQSGRIALSLLGLDSWISFQQAKRWKPDLALTEDEQGGKTP